VAIIGNTIRIYWVEKWPEPEVDLPDELDAAWQLGLADQLLVETRWYDRAAVHYRGYLESRPNDSPVWFRLGVALLEAGRVPDALAAFGKAVEFDPAPGKLNLRIAETLLKAHRSEAAEKFARAAVSQLPGDRNARDLLNRLAIPHR
jgi:cytochrome c-type biogenesis protein CcmH/NrfG